MLSLQPMRLVSFAAWPKRRRRTRGVHGGRGRHFGKTRHGVVAGVFLLHPFSMFTCLSSRAEWIDHPSRTRRARSSLPTASRPRAVRGDLRLTLPRHQGNIDRALEPFRGTDGAHDSAGQRAAVRTVAAGEETRGGFPKRMASGAVSHLAGEEEEQFFVLEVGEERGTQHDERAGVRAEGVGVPLLITGNINVGHFGQAKNARSENGLLPDFGQLFGAEANAVEGGFDPRAADFVRGGAHDGVESGNLLQPVIAWPSCAQRKTARSSW